MLAVPSLEVCKHAACLRKFALRTPKNGPNLRNYALETGPGAGCENMHSVKIIPITIPVECRVTLREQRRHMHSLSRMRVILF